MAQKTIDWGEIGELRYYPYRQYGFCEFRCNCGDNVKMTLKRSGKLDRKAPIELHFTHRNRERRYTNMEPRGHEIIKRFEGVMSYVDCRIPWK